MTTIVGDWRRKILVSDSQISDEGSGIKYRQPKVHAVPGGWFAGAGVIPQIQKALRFMRGDLKRKPKLTGGNAFLLLTQDGLYSAVDTLDWTLESEFVAIGSGAMAAEALMRHGLAAEMAVDGACDVDLMSSAPVRVYGLDNAEPTIWAK